ncbi:MAG TPA: hypothetical protein VLA93_12240 [Pyrinomonadaceae bacterium]|nr:hypothetical protein [Pyrinomonadaceae bacterium]
MSESVPQQNALSWATLSPELRELLGGKLVGIWGAPSDEAAFDSWPIDKQQALLLLALRLQQMGLWHLVRQVTNVYGEGGVGIQFLAWPMIESTLKRRRDFTRRFANHNDTSGGFYEKRRADAVLHFLFQEGEPRLWYVHFDLYSPVHSLSSALKHLRHEFIGKVRPDWQMIAKSLKA